MDNHGVRVSTRPHPHFYKIILAPRHDLFWDTISFLLPHQQQTQNNDPTLMTRPFTECRFVPSRTDRLSFGHFAAARGAGTESRRWDLAADD